MKKAKVIIPALAVLAFSTIASVTGTVAWFTTQSSVTINTSNFAITGLSGDLACDLSAGVGTTTKTTTVDSKSVTTIEAISGTSLTHGSFDHKTGKLYTLRPYSDVCDQHTGADIASIKGKTFPTDDTSGVLSDPFLENPSNKTIFNAYTFNLKFQVGDGTSWNNGYDLNLYFDFRAEKSAATATDAPLDGTSNSARGLRVAFVNTGTTTGNTGVAKVWSPLQGTTMGITKSDTTSDASCYQSASDATTLYDTDADGDLMWQGEGAGLLEGASTGDTTLGYIKDDDDAIVARTDYLGQFNSTNNGVVNLTCVVWFEGNDDLNVSNDSNKKPAVSVKMSFYVKQNHVVS